MPKLGTVLLTLVGVACVGSAHGAEHPRLLFGAGEVAAIRQRAKTPVLQPFAARLIQRAEWQLHAARLVPSITKRGEPDPPGEQKGLASARALQGRVLTYCMAFTLTGDRKYRDAAVTELRRAIDDWRIWVDTAHAPPYDLMNGELCLTFGLAYDWLYHDLTAEEREQLRKGVERRGLQAYLDAAHQPRPPSFFTAQHNWNPVCNGGAAVLALALGEESDLSEPALAIAVPAMDHYWKHLGDDGGWDEGTGYWTYGHRYAFIAAEALRRSGRPGGAERFALPGARQTGYFPLVFNPGAVLTAGFGDSNGRVNDPILYLLGREYRNPDFVWFEDRAGLPRIDRDGWPHEALALIWRPVGEPWLPEATPGFKPNVPARTVFPSVGWGFMSPSQPDPPFFLALKNGSLAANHTHLDLNHINLGVGDTMLVVELGSRPYPADYFGARRYTYYELTTAAHSTVLVGGKGQVAGRSGKLLDPIVGPRFYALTGVADAAYEAGVSRARRHVVFVDNRYWVLLDEISTQEPQPVQLRFHTYANPHEVEPNQWALEQNGVGVDIAASTSGVMKVTTESPQGWIRPVQVLTFSAEAPQTEHAIVTLFWPRRVTVPGSDPRTVLGSDPRTGLGSDPRTVLGSDPRTVVGSDPGLTPASGMTPASGTARNVGHAPGLRVARQGAHLDVSVGEDRIQFENTLDGWRITTVTVGSGQGR